MREGERERDLPVADDHESSQESLVSEPSLSPPDQGSVHLAIKYTLELLLLLLVVTQQVGLLGFVRLGLNLLHCLLHDVAHGLLVFGGKVKIRLKSGRSLQPALRIL